MKIYRSNCCENAQNVKYEIEEEIGGLKDFNRAVKYDHVMCAFKENKRSITNFENCDVLYADVDNASDKKEDWVSVNDFRHQFSDYEYYLATSRNHNKKKDGKAARNKFHVYFPIKEVNSKEELSALLKALTTKYALFDKSVKDPSRFFFGNKNAKVYHNSGKSILEDLREPQSTKPTKSILDIKKGERNIELFKAACAYKNTGIDQEMVKRMVEEINNSLPDPSDSKEIDSIVASAYRYENLDEYMTFEEAMMWFEEKYIIIKVGSKTVVLDKITYEMQDYKNASLFYANKKIKMPYADKQGKIKESIQSAFPVWFEKTHQRYERLVFKPGNNLSQDEYNLWTGFAFEANESGNCDLYLDHIRRNICGDDDLLYEFVLDWMAQTIKEPDKRPGIALAIRGEQGVGKGVFAQTFGQLFGDHYLYVNDLYSLTNHFNGHLANKLLVFADEAIWGGDKKAESCLKSLISEPTEVIEYKGKDAVRMDNYKRIIFATNSDWVVPVDKDDRRYVVLDVAANNKKDRDYFGRLIQQMENGGYEKLEYLLENRDLSKRDWSKLPTTKAKVENIVLGFNAISKWIYDCLEAGYEQKLLLNNTNIFADQSGGKEISLRTNVVFDMFDTYNTKYKMGGKFIDDRSIGIWLSKVIGVEKVKKQTKGMRNYYYMIPSLKKCRETFNKYIGYDLFCEGNEE